MMNENINAEMSNVNVDMSKSTIADIHIPYIAHEYMMARLERTINRLWVLCIILIFIIISTNVAWLIYESQYDKTTITQENEGAPNNYIGNDGEISQEHPDG